MRILIIDENAGDRKRTIELLDRHLPGARFVQPASPAEVNAALVWGDFDLVLTEYRLSWIDGLALLRMLKSLQPQVPVIVLTAFDSADTAAQAMKAGLADYVVKRHAAQRLLPAVQEALAGAQPVGEPDSSLHRTPPVVIALSPEAQAEADRLWEQLHKEIRAASGSAADISGPKPELQEIVRHLYVEPGQQPQLDQ